MTRHVLDQPRIKTGELTSLMVIGLLMPVLLLLSTGIVRADEKGDALYAATSEADENEVKTLIDNGADVNYVTEEGGWTCLHVAAYSGFTNITKMLLEADADASPQEGNGWTPLHMAVYYGHLETVVALLDGGARLDLTMPDGRTPLDLAVDVENNTLADLITARGGKGKTLGTNLYNAASEGDLEEVKRLVEMGTAVDSTAPDARGYTPLHVAAFSGNSEVVRYLLANGADKESLAGHRFTPLFSAAKEGHAEIVTILIEAGANTKHQNSSLQTPLAVAAERGHVEVAEVLLDRGVDPNFGTSVARPVIFAAMNGHLEMVRLLVERGAEVNPDKGLAYDAALHFATRAGNLEMTKLLLSLGARPNIVNHEGKSPLDLAIASGNKKLVTFLESKGALQGEVIKPAAGGQE